MYAAKKCKRSFPRFLFQRLSKFLCFFRNLVEMRKTLEVVEKESAHWSVAVAMVMEGGSSGAIIEEKRREMRGVGAI